MLHASAVKEADVEEAATVTFAREEAFEEAAVEEATEEKIAMKKQFLRKPG